eukprot:2574043-Amphidinium_carterae.2
MKGYEPYSSRGSSTTHWRMCCVALRCLHYFTDTFLHNPPQHTTTCSPMGRHGKHCDPRLGHWSWTSSFLTYP